MQNKKLYSINKEAVLLLVLLCVLSYVHLNDASEQVLENYHKSSARWKRNIETKETNTKPQRRKFGLAWLFSYQEDEENDKAKSQQYPDIDKRIRGTWMTLEATKKEQRLEVKGNGQYSRWKSIDWNNRNCSQVSKLTSITRSKPVIVTPTDQRSRFEALTEDTIHLKCSFHNVHHEVDMDRFSVQWISSKYHPKRQQEQPAGNTPQDEESCAEKMKYAPQLIKTDVPKCRMSTDFPFDDLKSAVMNISCESTLTLRNVSTFNSASYTCRAKIGFKTIETEQRNRRKIRNKNPPEEESFMSNYEMSVELLVRVSRRNDYYVHKIVALVVGGVVVITLFLLLGKKALGHKLGWESKETCNYAPEWNAAPARTIASAGSLHHSRSTLRRPSEPCIAEEVEVDEEDYLYLKPDHSRSSSDHFYNEDEDQNEMNEFLRKVKSHGSFKFTIGGDESPRSLPRNPHLTRVQNTT